MELGNLESTRNPGIKTTSTSLVTTDSINREAEFEAARMRQEIEDVAEKMNDENASYSVSSTPPLGEKSSGLDPLAPDFDARAWVKNFVSLAQSDPKSAPPRALGVAFSNLSVFGWSTGTEFQKTVWEILVGYATSTASLLRGNRQGNRIDILRDFEGIVEKGEMLLVLGPPGAGCSTLLKTLAGETAGFRVSRNSNINFRGIDLEHMRSSFRGDVVYMAENDNHLAALTVGETLSFAARMRSPRHIAGGFPRKKFDALTRDVMIAVFGLSHTINTPVGDNIIRGVSGGERRRVSIAEAALTGAKFQCWDNATRGLDSGNAVSFCRHLRLQADLMGVASAVSLYQAPQSAYDLFDRVTVLYEGRQIYFGRTSEAKSYFESLGFECPSRQTTPDFLTSMTSSIERHVRAGFEELVPHTPDEFAEKWKASNQRQQLSQELATYQQKHPSETRLAEYQHSRHAEQAKGQRVNSAYTISYVQQLSVTLWRAYRRLLADPAFTIMSLVFNLLIGLILGSLYYNLKEDTSSFFYRGGLIFFSLLFNAFASQIEVLTIYVERPVVEKHKRYAFYHQSAQAIASYAMDLPYKVVNMFMFNLIIYFMGNLRREPGAFFFFCLTSILVTLIQSGIFRTLACLTRTPEQAMVPTTLLSLGLIVYSGFTIPTTYMLGWSRWMNYLNPVAHGFEALMANEFENREFPCASMIPYGPGYEALPAVSQICSVVGAEPGSSVVSGDRYINLTYDYSASHKWRNIGILCGYFVFFFSTYLIAAEFAKPPKTKGEVLVFQRGKTPSETTEKESSDLEKQPQGDGVNESAGLTAGTSVFHWEDLCYDIKIKGGERRLLDHVDGWVKPGVATALMGVSGAGKTTLLDVLATRVTVGVVSGETMINGHPTDASFQHRVGYVQQQDLHLSTMTVREALEFSALLRQSAEIPRQQKLQYVDHVIEMLDMQDFEGAIIGVPGEGLNIEQRKRLTIGVELAARPQLLLFFDEPTSGLDAQTSWTISQLIRKLTNSGQAVLCTIHQPSAILFNQFDRLLLIAPGGKTAYFGDLGNHATTLIDYFERNGAPPCPPTENPAEWMLEIIGDKSIDWHQAWRHSPEYQSVKNELARLRALSSSNHANAVTDAHGDESQHHEFVASFSTQFRAVFVRTVKHFWRSPVYIWSKTILIILYGLYLGFSYKANNTISGITSQVWAVFMYFTLFINLNEQIMPMFVPQRALYEARERPSKIYRWSTYVMSNILVELGWNTLMAVIIFFCSYYAIDFVRNTNSGDQTERGGLFFLLLWQYMLFVSTFAHSAIVWIDLPEMASTLTLFLWMLCILFCGVPVARNDLPGFWTFMNRVSPATYLVNGLASAAVANAEIRCASNEILHLIPAANQTCSDFLGSFSDSTGGKVLNPSARDVCSYCPTSNSNTMLAEFDIHYANRWRDFGILWVYIFVNIGIALGFYWIFRVPKKVGTRKADAEKD